MRGSPVVLEVGPDGICCRDCGSRPPREMVAAALDGIDDPVVLLDERPVRVDDLLRSVIAQTLGGHCADVLVLHPSSWPAPRVSRVVRAVRGCADRVTAAPDDGPMEEVKPEPSRRRIRLRPNVIGAVLGAMAVAAAVALPAHSRPAGESPPAAVVAATVTEGRVAVLVPEGWNVERITRGPGSRRVQVSSPADPDLALHITQSYAPGSTLADAGVVLGRAAAGPAFSGFRADDLVAGRPALTYREIRPGRVIRWAVLLDGVTRISIGCQSRSGAEEGIQSACEQAIRSARDLGGTAAGH